MPEPNYANVSLDFELALPTFLFSHFFFNCSVMSNSLWAHGLQLTRLPSFTISQSLLKFMSIELVMPSKHHLLCHALLPLPLIFPSIRVFFKELALYIPWPKYWTFSLSTCPFNEYSRLISFRIDSFDLLVLQGALNSPPTPQFKISNSSVLNLLYGPILTFIHDYWKKS